MSANQSGSCVLIREYEMSHGPCIHRKESICTSNLMVYHNTKYKSTHSGSRS
ncbi:hypothetical protein CFBP6109_02687 [Pseudomonas syringae pv. cerasicola]|nr:hypothetical protein CFBP6109_02687 [Pseudomonas syringae pv. cerasicola]